MYMFLKLMQAASGGGDLRCGNIEAKDWKNLEKGRMEGILHPTSFTVLPI